MRAGLRGARPRFCVAGRRRWAWGRGICADDFDYVRGECGGETAVPAAVGGRQRRAADRADDLADLYDGRFDRPQRKPAAKPWLDRAGQRGVLPALDGRVGRGGLSFHPPHLPAAGRAGCGRRRHTAPEKPDTTVSIPLLLMQIPLLSTQYSGSVPGPSRSPSSDQCPHWRLPGHWLWRGWYWPPGSFPGR